MWAYSSRSANSKKATKGSLTVRKINKEDYGEKEHDDLRIMWHQLMGKDFMGSKVIIMRSLDSIDSKGGIMAKTAKIEVRCNLKCTLVHQDILPIASQGRSRLGESGSTV